MAQWRVKTDQKAESKGKTAPGWLERKDASNYHVALGLALGAMEEQRNLAFLLSRNTVTGMMRQKSPDELAEYIGRVTTVVPAGGELIGLQHNYKWPPGTVLCFFEWKWWIEPQFFFRHQIIG